jgi:integrase
MATVVIQRRRRKNHISYLVSYGDPFSGRKKHYKTFHRKRDAQQAANNLRALIDSGKVSEIQKYKGRLSLLTFGEVSTLLQKKWEERFVSGDLRQKTFEEYVYRSNLINRTFGRQLLCEISKEVIVDFRSKVASESSNVTSNRSLFIIKQVFQYAMELRAVSEDITSTIKYLSEKEHERNKFLLPTVLDRLIEASQKGRSRFYLPALIYLGAEHGASKQEVLSLKWSDIDFEYEGQGMIRFFRTKTGKERAEYLMPRTKEALREWRDHQNWMRHRKKIDAGGSELVFCKLNGRPTKSFYRAWRKACKSVGLEDFHFHDLRHTFCSNLLLSGSDLKDVKEMIGHSDLSMTDRYSHLTLAHKRHQQNMLAEHYSNGNSESGDKKDEGSDE